MTLTLLILGLIAAANPFRAAAATPDERDRVLPAVAFVGTALLTLVAAMLSGPLLDLVDVTGPSARIAAGIALLVVAAKDVFVTPPSPEPALEGWRAGVVPLTFPVIFSPAVALLAVAGASERGVAIVLLAACVALVPVGIAVWFSPLRRVRALVSMTGVAGVGIAALVVLDGVYAI